MRYYRLLRWGALLFLIVPPVPAYVAANELGTVDPEAKLNAGEVVVLSRLDDVAGNHQVQLSMDADPLPADGVLPDVLYKVAVCGSGPFIGLLLVSGSASLHEHAARNTQSEAVTATAVEQGAFTTASEEPAGGSGQMFAVEVASPPACAGDAASLDTSGSFAGAVFTVFGRLTTRITTRRDWGFGLVGARQWQAWPSVGGFRAMPTASGVFTRRADNTRWVRPTLLVVQVTSALPTGQTVASAAPPPAASSGLSWRSRRTITPTARLVDVDQVVHWQRVSLYLGLWIAVGLSGLATLVLDWLRRSGGPETPCGTCNHRHGPDKDRTPEATPPPPVGTTTEPTTTPKIRVSSSLPLHRDLRVWQWAALAAAAGVICAAVRRFQRRSDPRLPSRRA